MFSRKVCHMHLGKYRDTKLGMQDGHISMLGIRI
jgi:hypothetical protein